MLHQVIAENYDEKSGSQRAIYGQCMFRVVNDSRSASGWKKSEWKTSYPDYTTVLNLKDIVFPMTLNQIKKFENLNDISIIVSRSRKNSRSYRYDSPI